jgi:hypothetical protein
MKSLISMPQHRIVEQKQLLAWLEQDITFAEMLPAK